MDMTQFLLAGGQRVFLVLVLDIFLRRIVGWRLFPPLPGSGMAGSPGHGAPG